MFLTLITFSLITHWYPFLTFLIIKLVLTTIHFCLFIKDFNCFFVTSDKLLTVGFVSTHSTGVRLSGLNYKETFGILLKGPVRLLRSLLWLQSFFFYYQCFRLFDHNFFSSDLFQYFYCYNYFLLNWLKCSFKWFKCVA
jgi:hypothetical protein